MSFDQCEAFQEQVFLTGSKGFFFSCSLEILQKLLNFILLLLYSSCIRRNKQAYLGSISALANLETFFSITRLNMMWRARDAGAEALYL